MKRKINILVCLPNIRQFSRSSCINILLDYDARGNLTHIERETNNPDLPMDTSRESVQKLVWDEEDRLLAVDLRPESDRGQPHIAAYTYDAGGERGIRYVPRQQEGVSSGATSGYVQDMDIMLYPNALVTVRPQELTEEFNFREPPPEYTFTTYTKHYYIGSERINSKLGTRKDLGIMCEQLGLYPDLIDEMNWRIEEAGEQMNVLYSNLDKDLRLPTPHYYDSNFNLICFEPSHHPELYDAYWYHPDHLGSSSFITNTTGEISQHFEYLPFGETLVEEHLNSYNSPFKFNGKEYDAETGNYYYGARYLNPKWSMWLGVDPLYEMYPGISPYSFTANNPIGNKEVDGRWWFKNNTPKSPYSRSKYSYMMSNVKAVHAKQTSLASYIPIIGNILNASAMIQKVEDPSMKLDKGDYASVVLGAYFKGTRSAIKFAKAYFGGAKTALKLTEEMVTLGSNIASYPELTESWVELSVMEHFANETSESGNKIGFLRGVDDKSYTTVFNFSEEFISELQDNYGKEHDGLKNYPKMDKDDYINRKVEGHLQQMFENKKNEVLNNLND